MSSNTDDLRIQNLRELVVPEALIAGLPAEGPLAEHVNASRTVIQSILEKTDDRLVVVVGPCSIHDSKQALAYADRLKPLMERYEKELHLVMRVYFEKPRTTVGWKGFINDPKLDNSFDINRGLRLARTLLLELASRGIPAGTEFLDTISPQFVADLVTWGAIGARTTESQVHRELASGLSMPVGFKNGTDGNIKIAIDAIGAAQRPHSFLSVTKQGVAAIVRTLGNPSCHVILRGSSQGTNYDAASIRGVVEKLEAAHLPPCVMVDCSHGNSGKDYRKQPSVASEVAAQIRDGGTAIGGVMLESHLVEGAQKVIPGQELVYGQSITDQCISWEKTEGVLAELAEAVAVGRLQG